jgi:8-oxo-dGTP pyrophosphatase MutT (NUDIX family)
MSFRTRVALKCLIVDKLSGQVLALKRPDNDESRPGAWDLCGGSLSKRDMPSEDFKGYGGDDDILMVGLRREILEETGLNPVNIRLCYAVSGYKAEKGKLKIGHMYIGEVDKKKDIPVLSEEHVEYKWIEPEEFIKLDFGNENARQIITKVIDYL